MTVLQQQCLLTYLGYDPGPIDGQDGPRTQAALAQFTSEFGLGADGLVGAVAGTVAQIDKPAAPSSPQSGTFWDNIKHFSRGEFRCPCGNCGGYPVEPHESIVTEAEALRDHLGVPVTIVPLTGDPHAGGSGVRCVAYNATFSNSASNSRHLSGKAVDFSAPAPASKIEAWLESRRNAGKLRYWYRITSTSWHMDTN